MDKFQKTLLFITRKMSSMDKEGLGRYLNTRVIVKWAGHHKSRINELIILKSTPRPRPCQELKDVDRKLWSCQGK